MRPDRTRALAGLVEWLLIVFGVACLTLYGLRSYQTDRLERENRDAVALMLEHTTPVTFSPQPSALSSEPSALWDGAFIARLDIPRLGVSAAVRAGDDQEVLDGAVGYLPDTPPPWEDGNTTLAAHRDRLFRSLSHIRIGDEILVSTGHGDFQYRVSRTFVVNRADVWVVKPAPGVDLTLITCYPFSYVGHAPQRFVVRARKILTPHAATSAH